MVVDAACFLSFLLPSFLKLLLLTARPLQFYFLFLLLIILLLSRSLQLHLHLHLHLLLPLSTSLFCLRFASSLLFVFFVFFG